MNIIEKAKQKGCIKTYKEFCETDVGKKYCMSDEESKTYIQKNN